MSKYPQYQEDLFIRGFLVTDQLSIDLDSFPFYGKWKKMIGGGTYY